MGLFASWTMVSTFLDVEWSCKKLIKPYLTCAGTYFSIFGCSRAS